MRSQLRDWSRVALVAALMAGCHDAADLDAATATRGSELITPSAVAYMAGLVQQNGGKAVRLDFTDAAQYEFVQKRVRAAGKTPENSPRFFQMLDRIRTRQLREKQLAAPEICYPVPVGGNVKCPAPPTPPDPCAAAGADCLIPSPPDLPPAGDHLVVDLVRLADGVTFEATTFSTVAGGSLYTYTDALAMNSSYVQIGNLGYDEQYSAGTKVVAKSYGNVAAIGEAAWVDSMEIVTYPNGAEESTYVIARTHAFGGTVEEPRDKGGNGIITVCLNRRFNDCDYEVMGQTVVKFPMKGSMTFDFPVAAVIRDPAKTYAKLSKAANGNTHQMIYTSFANQVAIDPVNRKRVYWDIPQDSAIFNGLLFQSSEEVNFFLAVAVQLQRPNSPEVVGLISTVADDNVPSNYREPFPPMQIVYSCLAEGTKIRLGAGEAVKIESVDVGGMVATSSTGDGIAAVEDVSVGIEQIPMVRLVDEQGRELLLTETHPVLTPDRGVVWAGELAKGDKVLTETGASQLTEVGREAYDGNVYNLKLDANGESTEYRGSTMYANGFLVGDLAMQSAYEFKNRNTATALEQIPADWHTDYLNSQARLAKQAARPARPE